MENSNKPYKLPDVTKGIIVANVFAFLAMGFTKLLPDHSSEANGIKGLFIMSDFIIIPIVMGIINAYYWQNLKLKTRDRLFHAFTNLCIVIIVSILFLGEGFICLIIVSPLIYLFIVVGVYIGKAIYEKRNNNLNASVIGLLVVVFVVDILSNHNYEKKVTDEIVINATPDKIWPHVVAFDPIKEKPSFWMFKIGMPMPMQTTVDGFYQGAGRKCIFNSKVIFDEKMVVFQPGGNLTFDIVKQPADPEILGHIVIERGQFLLKDNGNGTTTLTGNSWYKLKVFPALYFNLWAESITRNVHLRVMQHIKLLSEQKTI